ncbi:MAG: hypothetical protein IJQ31_07295 [Thermoguttaceae bacterium]|nr:hypothetical protein [Thermoguttaceae bacterium]
MALTLIVGKPGSGKSYFAVKKIAEMVLDWLSYEKREGKPFERVLYTNLHLNDDAFNEYIAEHVGNGFDIKNYYKFIDTDFFYAKDSAGHRNPCKWWENIPVKALIVIDEVHQYLPAGGTGSKDYMQEFVEYVSTHRHKEHDIIFITQHPDNINRSILNMAADVYHIINIKNRVLPWIGIPFADIDVVKEAWGCKRQVANALYGNYVGRSFRAQNNVTFQLKPEIFALYQSHTLLNGQGGGEDRPDLKLGKIGSLFWFAKRHIWHLSFKAGLVYAAFWGIRFMLSQAPQIFADGMTKGMKVEVPSNPESSAADPVPVSTPSSPPGSNYKYKSEKVPEKKDIKEKIQNDFYNDSGIFIYGPDYIITRNEGRVNVGETFNFQGESVVLLSVDYKYKKLRYRTNDLDGVQPAGTAGTGFFGNSVSDGAGGADGIFGGKDSNYYDVRSSPNFDGFGRNIGSNWGLDCLE